MELDNLRNLWKKDEITETPEISTEQQNELHNPLQKIRRNMRMEFWMTVLVLVPVLVALFFGIQSLKLKTYTFTIIFVMLCVLGFYYNKFFLLYKELENVSINTKDALKDLLHQLELNKQYYISYYLVFAPFLVCEMILLHEFRFIDMPLQNESEFLQEISISAIFVLSTIFGLYLTYILGKFWFQQYYGKYIDNVTVLNAQINGGFEKELREIEKRNNTRFRKTERFLISKMGNNGKLVNTVLWLIAVVILSLIVMFIGGVIIGFTMSYLSK